MFDAIGRGGRTKPLSPWRWAGSCGIAALMIVATGVSYDVIQNGPSAKADEENEPTEVTFKAIAKALPPPPPPAAAPRSTVRPVKNVLTRAVVKKEIEEPPPTPIPKKDEKQPEKTPEPEPELAEAAGLGVGGPGGVVGGVIGGAIGAPGGTGSATFDPSNVQTLDYGEIKVLRAGRPKYPEFAKRSKIEDTVVVEISCAPDGSVADIRWVSGNVLFKEEVEAAIKASQYGPQSISFKFLQEFKFKLN